MNRKHPLFARSEGSDREEVTDGTFTTPEAAPGKSPGTYWYRLRPVSHSFLHEGTVLSDLIVDGRGFEGGISLVLPDTLEVKGGLEKALVGFTRHKDTRSKDKLEDWQERHRRELGEMLKHGRYNYRKAEMMLRALEEVRQQPLPVAQPGAVCEVRGLQLRAGEAYTAFLATQRPKKIELGDRFRFRVLQRQSGRKTVIGGSTYEVQILAPYHRETTGDSVAHERRGRKTHMEDNIEVHV
jgi:hypothetical protein